MRKWLVQVTSTRTTAYSSIHYRVVLTADKNTHVVLRAEGEIMLRAQLAQDTDQ